MAPNPSHDPFRSDSLLATHPPLSQAVVDNAEFPAIVDTLFSIAPVASLLLCLESFQILYLNPACYTLLGYTPRVPFTEILHPLDVKSLLAAIESLQHQGIFAFQSKQRLRCRDDKWIWITMTGKLIAHPNGRPSRLLLVLEDCFQPSSLNSLSYLQAIQKKSVQTTMPTQSFNALVSDTADRVKRIIQSLKQSIGAIDHNFHALVSLVHVYQRCCPELDLDQVMQNEREAIQLKELLEVVPDQVGQTQYLLADVEHFNTLLKSLSRTNHSDLYEEHYNS